MILIRSAPLPRLDADIREEERENAAATGQDGRIAEQALNEARFLDRRRRRCLYRGGRRLGRRGGSGRLLRHRLLRLRRGRLLRWGRRRRGGLLHWSRRCCGRLLLQLCHAFAA
ncbi:hypothetical protein AZOA_11580 [Azoarcus sp. Aa7]|nr:hypothetical protein [Azoarcus sp. Aa7]